MGIGCSDVKNDETAPFYHLMAKDDSFHRGTKPVLLPRNPNEVKRGRIFSTQVLGAKMGTE